MDTELLKIFVEVMRRGNFAIVARDRNLDPSSISRSIRALEDELGVRLFQRTTRAMAPTQSAQAYFDRIAPLIDEMDKARFIVADADRPPSGLLRLTTSVAFGERRIAPVLPAFLAAYPDLSIELLLTDTPSDLVNERIDAAIRLGSLPDSTYVAHRLMQARYSVVASPEYLRTHATLANPTDLTRHQCALFTFAGYRDRWTFRESMGATFEVPVSGRLFVSSAVGVFEAARAGIGPALLADWQTSDDVRAGHLVRLFADYEVTARDFDTAVWFVYASKSYVPLKVRVLLDYLREAIPAHLARD